MLYLTVPVQWLMLLWFFFIIWNQDNETIDIVGWIIGMGLMCGVYGINIAHELGHRNTVHEKILAKTMLCSSLYLHFYVEHNRGHHRNVGTPEDAASAKLGESIYSFWLRTVTGSFISAWNIVRKERERKKTSTWSLRNEMIQYLLLELVVCGLVAYFFGWLVLIYFILVSLIGILLLESVNYIEHYGLRRQKINEFRYEDVQPWHSWNSDYIVGRLILFELTRHSDHHWDPSKPYQVLNAMPKEKELPAGYPAMIILALVPPLWFAVMNKRVPATSINTNAKEQ
jgi:alkane 1-monooxygenase